MLLKYLSDISACLNSKQAASHKHQHGFFYHPSRIIYASFPLKGSASRHPHATEQGEAGQGLAGCMGAGWDAGMETGTPLGAETQVPGTAACPRPLGCSPRGCRASAQLGHLHQLPGAVRDAEQAFQRIFIWNKFCLYTRFQIPLQLQVVVLL